VERDNKAGSPRQSEAEPHSGDTGPSLTIGQLAAQAGVTPEAIRYYEREGVVPPALRRGAGRYRRYSDADAERLSFIKHARELGFSLDAVRELLSLADDPARLCSDVDALARAHLEQVEVKLAQLSALRLELARLVAECRGGRSIAECQILRALAARQ
jgi:DNA-binding transcriptional MerR regulator